jgi:outer membrane protein assembly factor BamE (lipoprotein component of BamABCDE complex)
MKMLAAMVMAGALAGCAIHVGGPALGDYRILNDEIVARVQPGQTREEVLAMLGPPVQTMPFPRLGHTAWDYRMSDTWGYHAIFSVTFDARGIVVSKITQRIERDRSSDR